MLKPDSLRRALTDAVTVLKTSPEMLRIFVDTGVLPPPGGVVVIRKALHAQCHCDRLYR